MEIFKDKKILITGGTGTFGQAFTEFLLKTDIKKIYIFSRGELKQHEMRQKFNNDKRIAFLIGNVEDKERMYRALNGINYVVHAAAQKHVPSCECNPFEAVKTNILGAQNVIDAAIDRRVEKVIAISTDKAVNPINIYGVTKAAMEKLFVSGNAYSGGTTMFSCVRYGNVMNSRGSVIQLWKKLATEGKALPLTDPMMTRFWLTKIQAVEFVCHAFNLMAGGEIFIPKLPSMKVIDLAQAIDKNSDIESIGIRQGEKLHETLINEDEASQTLELRYHYVIYPNFYWLKNKRPDFGNDSKRLEHGFIYSSNKNDKWLKVNEMKEILKQYD